MLHRAIDRGLLEVALAILARADFYEVNARPQDGATALHWAVSAGSLPLCRAIVGRADFTELRAGVRGSGGTALQWARNQRRGEVAAFLQAAEAGRA